MPSLYLSVGGCGVTVYFRSFVTVIPQLKMFSTLIRVFVGLLIHTLIVPCATQNVDSIACTNGGSECSTIANSVCDLAATPKCKCAAYAPMSTTTCPATACVASTTCTPLDEHAECSGTTATDKCRCKTGYSVAVDGKCQLDVTSTTCTTTGTECNSITNAVCDASLLKCKCGTLSAMIANTCKGKACTASTTCTALDANSECSGTTTGSVCQCKTGYRMGRDGICVLPCTASTTCTALDANSECSGTTTGSVCQCKTGYLMGSDGKCVLPVTSIVCTATGTECNSITNALCDTTTMKCKCGGITDMIANTCTSKACTASTTCTALDANSQCSGTITGSVCQCKAGYLMGSDGKCASGASTVLVSITMLFACYRTRLL